MVKKKGWVRIIEATICAILIIAVVLIYAQDNNSYFNVEEYADVESAIDEVIAQPSMRASILNDNSNDVEQLFNLQLIERIKRSGIQVNSTICSFEQIDSAECNAPKTNKIKNIHAYERLVSTDLEVEYLPSKTKLIRIVVFEDR